MRSLTLAIQIQLLLAWNTYLLFNFDVVNFVWKTDEGGAETTVLLIFANFFSALIVDGLGAVGWVRKVFLGPAKIDSFSSQDFS